MKKIFSAILLLTYYLQAGATTPTAGSIPHSNRAAPPPKIDERAAKAMKDESMSLREGVIDKLDLAQGQMTVYGNVLTFNPATVQIFAKNSTVHSIYLLRVGAKIHFLSDVKDKTGKTVSVIYVD